MADDGPDGMEAVTAELYALDPGEFVAARNELAKRLRKAGERQLAAEVAKLRRPSPAAWAVNQLVRRHREDLEALVQAGEDLRSAQDRALGGGEPAELRQAARARREAVGRLTELAEAILAERGGTPGAHAGEVAATLEAASLDEESAGQVLSGQLTSELQPPSGFGLSDVPVAERPARKEQPPSPVEKGPSRRELEKAEEAVAEARQRWEERSAKAREAVDRVGDARRAVREAEVDVARLEDLLADAERRRRATVREAEHAEDAASRAEDAASRAAEVLRTAERRLAELEE